MITSKREERAGELLLHRVEHRDHGRSTVVARTSDVYARQQELSVHAAEFIAAAATGELVLVEEATGRDVARRSLWPEPPTPSSKRHGGDPQHDMRGWLGDDARSEPDWSPAPLPNQHRFADVETRSRMSGDCSRRDDAA